MHWIFPTHAAPPWCSSGRLFFSHTDLPHWPASCRGNLTCLHLLWSMEMLLSQGIGTLPALSECNVSPSLPLAPREGRHKGRNSGSGSSGVVEVGVKCHLGGFLASVARVKWSLMRLIFFILAHWFCNNKTIRLSGTLVMYNKGFSSNDQPSWFCWVNFWRSGGENGGSIRVCLCGGRFDFSLMSCQTLKNWAVGIENAPLKSD